MIVTLRLSLPKLNVPLQKYTALFSRIDELVFLHIPVDFAKIDAILEDSKVNNNKDGTSSRTVYDLRRSLIKTKLMVKRYKAGRQPVTEATAPDVKDVGKGLILQVRELYRWGDLVAVENDATTRKGPANDDTGIVAVSSK